MRIFFSFFTDTTRRFAFCLRILIVTLLIGGCKCSADKKEYYMKDSIAIMDHLETPNATSMIVVRNSLLSYLLKNWISSNSSSSLVPLKTGKILEWHHLHDLIPCNHFNNSINFYIKNLAIYCFPDNNYFTLLWKKLFFENYLYLNF